MKPKPLRPKIKRTSGWQRRLQAGDEVTWNDPNAGSSTRTGVLSHIVFLTENVAEITMTDNWSIQVYLSELS